MKKQLLLIAVVGLGFLISSFVSNSASETNSDGLKWYTSLDEVHTLSNETGKPIFGFFTGSDWCGWCHKLQRDVFAKEKFITWAKEKVILLELDFPKQKVLPDELKKQNAELQQAFGVRGYPTIWIFNSTKDETSGKMNLAALGKLGYPQGAVLGHEEDKFLSEANAILAKSN